MRQFILRKFGSLVHDHFQPLTRKQIVDVHFRLQLYLQSRDRIRKVCCKLVFLFQELPNNGVMLVYVSGDGCPGNAKAGEEGTWVQKNNHY